MSANDPTSPITPTTPQTPSFPSIPNLLNRTASQRTNSTTHRRNSSIISIPTSPMDTTLPPISASPSPCSSFALAPRRYSHAQAESEDHPIPTSPILDCLPSDTFTCLHPIARPTTSIASTLSPPSPSTTPTPPSPQAPNNPAYTAALQHVQSPLIPLVSVTTGQAHPRFPRTLLQYHLLTHSELDDLSRHYHQTEPPTTHSWRYPCRVKGWLRAPTTTTTMMSAAVAVPLDTKRRRFGRFIGLRGCESPIAASAMNMTTPPSRDQLGILIGNGIRIGSMDFDMLQVEAGSVDQPRAGEEAELEEQQHHHQQQQQQHDIEQRMEMEWRREMERRREEERLREKTWRGAW